MALAAVLAAAVLSAAAAAPATIGKTFGNGVAGFPLCAEPVTLVNHTLSAGATHGVLHHFWSTGGALKVDRLWVEYFLDGETTPFPILPPDCPRLACQQRPPPPPPPCGPTQVPRRPQPRARLFAPPRSSP
eukprot:COSAG06_NODE_21492_length_755_cov_0.910061_1_plen_131_part_00